MPRIFSSKHIENILISKGFIFVSQKGTHTKFRKLAWTVIVPANRREIPFGTFRSILRQSGLDLFDFEK